MTNQTETMSAEEAAGYLKASVRTVQELAVDGKLKGAKIGKGWVFFRRDVVAYLEGRIHGKVTIVRSEDFYSDAVPMRAKLEAGRTAQ